MTTRPRLAIDGNWAAGIAALALFGVMAAVFVTANFAEPTGFPTDESIVENIGYAMFNLDGQLGIPSEGFLVAFIMIAIVLDAALDGSLMLAKRDEASETMAKLTDGGRRFGFGSESDEETDRAETADGGED